MSHWTRGATISGKVTDEANESLPFVSVYIQGTTVGVTTNREGYYSIDLPVGNHDLIFQLISYKKHGEIVRVESPEQKIILNVKMEPQPYEIAEVTVTANAEDPAYEVMRKAIKMRKYYLNEVESYSCDVYIKGLQRVTRYPKKFMGFDVNAEGDIDPKTGIFYLSESVSKFYFKQPDKIHEVMVSSKVSGNSKAFSYNRTSDLLLNFYKSIMQVEVISKRGFVSPLAESAMLYYNYHLAGTFYENGKGINKIQVIPKRNHDPVFRGYIYITENTWCIHSTDLYLIKDAGIEMVDTLRINQVYLPVPASHLTPVPTPQSMGSNPSSEIWMLFSNKLSFSFSFLSFKGNGLFLSIHSKYYVKPGAATPPLGVVQKESEQAISAPPLSKRNTIKKQKTRSGKGEKNENKIFSTGEMMKVEEGANKKDTVYWAEMRPVPLTQEESTDYLKNDSLRSIHESKVFLDSADKETNKFKPANLLFGYDRKNRFKKRDYSFPPLIKNVQFNTVQGLVVHSEMEIHKKSESENNFYKTLSASYGFSDKKVNLMGKILYEFNHKKFTNIEAEGGRQTVQFSEKEPISPLVNTVYTLLEENNYMKLYQKDFLKVAYNSEVVNGIYLRSFLEYSNRTALLNTSDFVLFPAAKNGRTYTSNDPRNTRQDSIGSFKQNQSLELRINLRLRYRQKYVSRPDEKWVYGSRYPSLHLEYRKAIRNIFGSDMNYNLVKVSVTDKMDLKLFGRSSYLISTGKFLHTKRMEFMDYYHFSGNKTVFSNFDFTDFQLVDYYVYSTRDYFIEAHYEHNFRGFIFNKFPLLRQLNVNELAGIHYLHTDKIQNYFELFAGLQKLNLLRIDFVSSYADKKHLMTGLRMGLKLGR
jgi:Family of unknown function (DUF5686)/CarboxypepD_reg-like domain